MSNENTKRLDSIEGKVDTLEGKFDKLLAKQLTMEDALKETANKKDVRKILDAVDSIAKKHEDFETEFTFNRKAHDRIQKDVNEVRRHVSLKVKHPVLRPDKA